MVYMHFTELKHNLGDQNLWKKIVFLFQKTKKDWQNLQG